MKTGEGIMAYSNGSVYEGNWNQDKRSGKGIMTYINKNKFEGTFVNDTPNKGTMAYENGDYYKGQFEQDNPSGQGSMDYENGNHYEGKWKNGLKEGKGNFTYKKEELVYIANWVNDKLDGDVTVVFPENNVNHYKE